MALHSYIDKCVCGGGGVVATEPEAFHRFNMLQATLVRLGLDKAKHTACLPSQLIVWLCLQFNTINMTLSFPDEKLAEVSALVADWSSKKMEQFTSQENPLCCSVLPHPSHPQPTPRQIFCEQNVGHAQSLPN